MGVSSSARRQPSTAAVALALGLVYIIWGSTYFGIAVMIETMPPLLAAGVRYGTAGALMLGALVVHARFRRDRDAVERPNRAQWRAALIIGTLLLLGGNGGVVLSELFIPSGIAAVLIATVPIWLALFDAVLTRRRPSGLVIGGLTAGIVGVAVLLVPLQGVEGLSPVGIGLCFIAEISWAAGSLYARRAPLPRSLVMTTGMQMLAGGLMLVLAGSLLGEIGRTDVSEFSLSSIVAIVYLVIFGSIVAFTAYSWLLSNVAVSTVGTYAYVNPIVAVALGAIFLHEPITLRTLVATALILGAVVAMVSGRPRDAEEPGPTPDVAQLEPD